MSLNTSAFTPPSCGTGACTENRQKSGKTKIYTRVTRGNSWEKKPRRSDEA